MNITCVGPGPHDPPDGVLGETNSDIDPEMLCAPCSAAAVAEADSSPSTPTLTTVQVDPDAISSALAAAQKATTVAALRTAVIALGRQLQPDE